MDPDFIQHSVGDVSTRFAGMLLMLLGYSTFIYATVQWICTVEWFKDRIGQNKGEGKGFWMRFDLRPWISGLLGLTVAYGLHLNFALYLAGYTIKHLQQADILLASMGIWAFVPPAVTVLVGETVTGIALGAGPKLFVELSKTFGRTPDAILANMERKKGE